MIVLETANGITHLLALVCLHVISSAEVPPGNGHTLYLEDKKSEEDGDDAEMLKHRRSNSNLLFRFARCLEVAVSTTALAIFLCQ